MQCRKFVFYIYSRRLLLSCFRCHFVDNATQCCLRRLFYNLPHSRSIIGSGVASASPRLRLGSASQNSTITALKLKQDVRTATKQRGRCVRLLVYSSSRLKKQAAQPALAATLQVGLD